jgi:lipopolysaccharide exporter
MFSCKNQIVPKIVKRIFKSDFLKNLFTLITGSSVAQAITILLSPVFSRLFSPDEFGIFALFYSIVSAIAIISSGRYEGAIMLPKNDTDSFNILSLAMRICGFISLILICILAFAEVFIWDYFDIEPHIRIWLLVLPAFVFMLGITQTVLNWFVRKKQFKNVAYGRIIQSVFTNGSMLIFGFLGWSYWGIFSGNLIGLVCFTVFILIVVYRIYPTMKPHISKEKRKHLAKTYSDFPIANGPQAIIDMIQVNGIIYLTAAFFNTFITGLYSFAFRILMAPMNLLGSSMAQVFYQKASETYNSGSNLRQLIRKTMLLSAVIISPVLIALFLAGPAIFAFVFGEEWREAGEYSRILAPWFCLDFIRSPISQIPLIVGKIRKMLSFTFAGNMVLISTMLIGGLYFQDIKNTFILLSASMSLYTIVLLLWLYQSGKCKPST